MNAETMVPDSTYVDVDRVPWTKTRFPGIETKMLMENKTTAKRCMSEITASFTNGM